MYYYKKILKPYKRYKNNLLRHKLKRILKRKAFKQWYRHYLDAYQQEEKEKKNHQQKVWKLMVQRFDGDVPYTIEQWLFD